MLLEDVPEEVVPEQWLQSSLAAPSFGRDMI